MLPNLNIEHNDSSKLEKESKTSNVSDRETFQQSYYSNMPQKNKPIRKHHLSPLKQKSTKSIASPVFCPLWINFDNKSFNGMKPQLNLVHSPIITLRDYRKLKKNTLIDNYSSSSSSSSSSYSSEEDEDYNYDYIEEKNIKKCKEIEKEVKDSKSNEILQIHKESLQELDISEKIENEKTHKQNQHIKWDKINIREYKTSIAPTSIPSADGFPIGLSWTLLSEEEYDLEEYEKEKDKDKDHWNMKDFQENGALTVEERLNIFKKIKIPNSLVYLTMKNVDYTRQEREESLLKEKSKLFTQFVPFRYTPPSFNSLIARKTNKK